MGNQEGVGAMAAAKTSKAAALKSGAGNVLRFSLATLPLFPAIKINLDAAAGQGETWAVVGIGFVIFGALAIEHSLHALRWRQAITALLWGVLGAGFLALNGMNAIANLASHTDHSRDENRAKMQTAADISRQRDELAERRKEHAKLAGEATPDSIEAEIQASKAANSGLWRASQSCDANSITRDVTRAFCKSLADLEAKKAAATKRDEIDAKLAKLDEKAETKGEAPSTVDSFADAMADGLRAFGYQVSEKDKLAIVRARDWSKAIGVEVLAAFGPAALLGLFLRGVAPLPKPQTQQRDKPVIATICDDPATIAARPDLGGDDDIDAFFGSKLETSPGVAIPAGVLFKTWQAWCAETGRKPGTQKAFSPRIQRRVERDPNNGRPRYLHVRLKEAGERGRGHGLRLAVSNA
jgi:hypothetical protein